MANSYIKNATIVIMRLHFSTFSATKLIELITHHFRPRSGHSHDASGASGHFSNVFSMTAQTNTELVRYIQGGSKKVSCCTVIDISMARQ